MRTTRPDVATTFERPQADGLTAMRFSTCIEWPVGRSPDAARAMHVLGVVVSVVSAVSVVWRYLWFGVSAVLVVSGIGGVGGGRTLGRWLGRRLGRWLGPRHLAARVLAARLAPHPAMAAPAAVHAVTSTADSGPGTLRQAMLDANASSGTDRIEFNLPGCSPVCVIHPTIALPVITGGGIEIDGFSQPGSAPPTLSSPAVIRVALDGTDVENNNGLSIASPGNVVKGLAIYAFGWNGIAIGGPDAQSNTVWGNHIGLTATGIGLGSRRPNKFEGVFIGLGARSNTIGGDLLTQRNVISGNDFDGVAVHGAETRFNHITGNFIGPDASGTSKVPNAWDGVRLYGGAQQSRVGVIDHLGQRNVISGNDRDGVRLAGADTSASLDGNLIGTTADGGARQWRRWRARHATARLVSASARERHRRSGSSAATRVMASTWRAVRRSSSASSSESMRAAETRCPTTRDPRTMRR